jgi:hypothetical protein
MVEAHGIKTYGITIPFNGIIITISSESPIGSKLIMGNTRQTERALILCVLKIKNLLGCSAA